MEHFFINYKDEVKRLITESYEPAHLVSKEFEMTTSDITENLKSVLPASAVDEHVVYECLRELGFSPQEEKPLEFSWYFKRKKNV